MNTTHRNSVGPRTALVVIGLFAALVPSVSRAGDPPAPSEKPRARASASGEQGIDDTALRAMRSTSRDPSERGLERPRRAERVAMRAVAPAPDRGDTPPKRGKSKRKADKARAPSDAEESASDRKISLDEDFLVEGKLEKPNAFYILRRSQSGYDWARLDAKFLPLVLESVQDPLF